MNIAHCLLSLEVGGLEVLVSKLATRTASLGHKVIVICLDAKGSLSAELETSGVEVFCVGRRGGILDLSALLRMRRILKINSIDIVHSHNSEAYKYSAILRLTRSVGRLVHTQHGLVSDLNWKKRLVLRSLRKMADRVCSVSESVQTQLIGLGWAQANNSQTILNGVDTIGFSPSAKRREEMRKSFGFERNTMVCICVARIATVKNHRALVAGFGKLLSRSADVALLIVGDGPLYSEIRNMIVQDGLEKHITMLGERSDVLDLLRLSDVFVLISLTEGLSVALLEAMSVGVVPVVTDVGGNSEIIDSKQYGILLGNDVTGSLVGALQELSDDPERRKRMSVAARLRVEQAFNITATADRYLGTYGISGLQGNSTC